ncbi:GGDEF domain-containing protein [Rhodovarius crocodyli]|uniref:GGDEF domain-containing protein n=1 Tax=Rhodovarius crocodyli TaxID=1979269 RepID=A0A437M1Y1_9PROT|nr:bifunctional diguanylate cyclase/phosphodiesterase [Rhodovarius crocodyli]RVT91555.1 GGDEF domain-containing protein [Rhodovarius crocodyli]
MMTADISLAGLWLDWMPLLMLLVGLLAGRGIAMLRSGEVGPMGIAPLVACAIPLPLAPHWIAATPAQWLGLLGLTVAGTLFAALCASGLRTLPTARSGLWAGLFCAGLLPAGFGLFQAVARVMLDGTAHGIEGPPSTLLLVAALCGAASVPLMRLEGALAASGPVAMGLAFAAAARAGVPGAWGWPAFAALLAAPLSLMLLRGWGSERRLASAREDELAEAIVASLPEAAALLEDERLRALNPQLRQLIGQSEILLRERSLSDLFPRQGRALAAALAAGTGQGWQRADLLAARESIPVEVVARPVWPGHKGPRLLVVRDLRREQAQEERLTFLLQHDASTGLHNRAWLMRWLQEAVTRETGRQGAFNLMRIGMDGHGPFQALHGYAATEEMLRIQAERLRGLLPPGTTLARIEGGEFALLHEHGALAEPSERLARRVLDTLRAPVQLDGIARRVAFSIGIASFPQHGESADELMTAADLALLRARSARRGAQPADAERDQETLARWALAQELPAAIEGGQLRLWLQPQMRMSDMRLAGFEALLRWQHPVHGLIGPARFIEAAEAMGHINAVGQWVLEEAVRRAASWPLPVPVAVNVSPLQLERPGFVLEVEQALARHRLPAARLELEITESGLLENDGQAMQTLRRLHGRGVRISLDDFGAGYSSFSTLISFPFSKLKLDRSLVSGREGHSPREAIEAVLALGSALGIPVVAEGVETQEQLALLASLGCAQIQGYLIARPVSEAQARMELLDNQAAPPLLWRQPLALPDSAEKAQPHQQQEGRDEKGREGNAGQGQRPRAAAARAPRQAKAQRGQDGDDEGQQQRVGVDQRQDHGELDVAPAHDAQPPGGKQGGKGGDGAIGGPRQPLRRRVQQPGDGDAKSRKQRQVPDAPLAQIDNGNSRSPEA